MDRTETQDEFYQKVAEEYGAALARMAYAYEADPDLRRDLSQEIHLALWRRQVQWTMLASYLGLPRGA